MTELLKDMLGKYQVRVMLYSDMCNTFIVPMITDMEYRLVELRKVPNNERRIKYLEDQKSKIESYMHQCNRTIKDGHEVVGMLEAEYTAAQLIYDIQEQYIKTITLSADTFEARFKYVSDKLRSLKLQ